jgi:hypothetical protein
MKKRDGRTLDRRTMETIRMDAVARVRAGEEISSVMARHGPDHLVQVDGTHGGR